MTLDKFGNSMFSVMTVDKFGKHVHAHSISKHIKKSSDLHKIFQRFISDVKVRHRLVLTLAGNGTADNHGFYRIYNKGSDTFYVNTVYTGKVLKTNYVGNAILLINGEYIMKDLISLKLNDKIQVTKRFNTLPDTKFCIEILIEQNEKEEH